MPELTEDVVVAPGVAVDTWTVDTVDTVDGTSRPSGANFDGWACPVPLRDSPTIVMGHGGGGAMSAELIEHLFLPGVRRCRGRRTR